MTADTTDTNGAVEQVVAAARVALTMQAVGAMDTAGAGVAGAGSGP
jgi:hypothetical protein